MPSEPTDTRGAATFRTSAESYDRLVGRYSQALAEALIRRVGVLPGQSVLDVGCGPGGLLRALADRIGPERLAAVDPSESFVEACRERVPGADVRLAPAESLPFADARFDVVLSQLVVNFMDDPEAGVGEMRRVTRPDGIVASSVWDYAGEMTLLRKFWDAATALELPGAREGDEGEIMPFCNPTDLQRLWQGAGLGDVVVSELVVKAGYESFDDLWQPFETGVAPSGAFVASLGRPDRAALADELRRRLGSPEGSFTLTARAWCVVGQR